MKTRNDQSTNVLKPLNIEFSIRKPNTLLKSLKYNGTGNDKKLPKLNQIEIESIFAERNMKTMKNYIGGLMQKSEQSSENDINEATNETFN